MQSTPSLLSCHFVLEGSGQRCRGAGSTLSSSLGTSSAAALAPAGLSEPHSLDPLGSHATVCLSPHLSPAQEQQRHQVPAVTCPCRLPLGSSPPSPAAGLAGALANTPASRMWRLSFQWAVPPVPMAGQPGPWGRASSSGGGRGARSPQGLLCCPGAGWHPGSSASEAFLEVWQ